ncbi:hypothetical protein AB0M54_24240 [Actinoplanes sp. NPDC051470]|uniref:hypothetical protein n=1 Tax=Actinoplanes sp. NPDC051470 TaxID=3157224 RepID=UPI003430EF83
MGDPFFPHRSTGTEPQEQLLAKLVESLAEDPAYEAYDQPVTSMWDAGQYVKYIDPDGRVHYLRIVIQPYRRPDPGLRPQLP